MRLTRRGYSFAVRERPHDIPSADFSKDFPAPAATRARPGDESRAADFAERGERTLRPRLRLTPTAAAPDSDRGGA